MAEEKSKSGLIINIVLWGAVAGGIGYFARSYITKEPPAYALAQATPEGAVAHYLKTAYAYIHTEAGGTYEDVADAVTEGDINWFRDNYQSLTADPFGIRTGADPVTAGALDKRLAMMNLMQAGVDRPDAKTISSSVSGNQADFVLRKRIERGVFYDYKVRVVQENGLWKMAGFAGGRAQMEGTAAPGDVVYLTDEDLPVEERDVKPRGAAPPPPPKQTAASAAPADPAPAAAASSATTSSAAAAPASDEDDPWGADPATDPPATAAASQPDTPAPAAAAANGANDTAADSPWGEVPAEADVLESVGVSQIKLAEMLIMQAAQSWERNDFEGALSRAHKARAIYEKELEPDDPRLGRVMDMIGAAEARLGKR